MRRNPTWARCVGHPRHQQQRHRQTQGRAGHRGGGQPGRGRSRQARRWRTSRSGRNELWRSQSLRQRLRVECQGVAKFARWGLALGAQSKQAHCCHRPHSHRRPCSCQDNARRTHQSLRVERQGAARPWRPRSRPPPSSPAPPPRSPAAPSRSTCRRLASVLPPCIPDPATQHRSAIRSPCNPPRNSPCGPPLNPPCNSSHDPPCSPPRDPPCNPSLYPPLDPPRSPPRDPSCDSPCDPPCQLEGRSCGVT